MIPKDLKYTKDHEWVRIEGEEGTIGITDHAQRQLGDITFVDLPKKGKGIRQGESFSTVESVKAASDIYAPLSGEIVDVNAKLSDKPEAVNKSPYGEGWIAKLRIITPSEEKNLMDSALYEKYLKEVEK